MLQRFALPLLTRLPTPACVDRTHSASSVGEGSRSLLPSRGDREHGAGSFGPRPGTLRSRADSALSGLGDLPRSALPGPGHTTIPPRPGSHPQPQADGTEEAPGMWWVILLENKVFIKRAAPAP